MAILSMWIGLDKVDLSLTAVIELTDKISSLSSPVEAQHEELILPSVFRYVPQVRIEPQPCDQESQGLTLSQLSYQMWKIAVNKQ